MQTNGAKTRLQYRVAGSPRKGVTELAWSYERDPVLFFMVLALLSGEVSAIKVWLHHGWIRYPVVPYSRKTGTHGMMH